MNTRAIFTLVSILLAPFSGHGATPSINFTRIPNPRDVDDVVHGQTTGASRQTHGIAIFVGFVGQGYESWWIKPHWGSITPIDTKGRFSAHTYTGGVDEQSSALAAFIVPLTIHIPIAEGGPIPSVVLTNAIASTYFDKRTLERPKENLSFSGFTWEKADTSYDLASWNYYPGQMSTDNAIVDKDGHLHLKISFHNGVNWGAAVTLHKPLGAGIYRFHHKTSWLKTPEGDISVHMTLGNAPFGPGISYSNNTNRMDKKWRHHGTPPPDSHPDPVKFALPTTVSNLTHSIAWNPQSFEIDRTTISTYTGKVENRTLFKIVRSVYFPRSPKFEDDAFRSERFPYNSSGVLSLSNVIPQSVIVALPFEKLVDQPRYFTYTLYKGVVEPEPLIATDILAEGDWSAKGQVQIFFGLNHLEFPSQNNPNPGKTYEIVIDKFEFIPFPETRLIMERATENDINGIRLLFESK